MNELKNKYKKKGISIKINNTLIEDIISKSEYESYGARKIHKIIKDDVENVIIDGILNDQKDINIKTIKALT